MIKNINLLNPINNYFKPSHLLLVLYSLPSDYFSVQSSILIIRIISYTLIILAINLNFLRDHPM